MASWLERIFGSGNPPPAREKNIGARGAVDPAFLEAFDILSVEATGIAKVLVDSVFRTHLERAEYAEARQVLQAKILPNVTKATYEKVMNAGGGESWANFHDVNDAYLFSRDDAVPIESVFLGRFRYSPERVLELRSRDEGHILTIAPTGAGKGQRYIFPNTFKYLGPLVCIDPKGENYREYAWRRSIYGNVFKFAPFENDTDCFNPLDFINGWEEARILSELLIIPSGRGEPFWDISAQSLVRGLIMFVKATREPELQNLREVCRLLSPSPKEREDMFDKMRTLGDERFLELANEIEDMSENLRKSIYAVANSHMQPWRDEYIAAATSSSQEKWSPARIYDDMDIEERWAKGTGEPVGPKVEDGLLFRGTSASVFLILPPEKIASYGSVLRVILGLHIMEIQKTSAKVQAEEKSDFRLQRSILFLLDELPLLGYMGILENAVAVARSAGIKLWFFAQDLTQLQQTYPKWESIVSNCKVQVFFKPGDLGTAEYLSRRLGVRKDIFGGQSPLASPQQLMGPDFEDKVIILKSGVKPIKALQPVPFHEDEFIRHVIANDKIDVLAIPERERRKLKEQEPEN